MNIIFFLIGTNLIAGCSGAEFFDIPENTPGKIRSLALAIKTVLKNAEKQIKKTVSFHSSSLNETYPAKAYNPASREQKKSLK